MWQDYVIAALQIFFTAVLIPTILDPVHKPNIWTSGPNAVLALIFAATTLTLDLRYTAGLMTINAVAWATLAWQRYWLDRRSPNQKAP